MINQGWFLKYEYRFGSSLNFNLGYDIFFYQDSFSITKIHLMEDYPPKYYTLDKSKLDILKSKIYNIKLPQDVSSKYICDGYASYIIIKSNGSIKKYGGSNPCNSKYLQLEKLIQKIIKI